MKSHEYHKNQNYTVNVLYENWNGLLMKERKNRRKYLGIYTGKYIRKIYPGIFCDFGSDWGKEMFMA